MFKSKKATKANYVLTPHEELAEESRKLISFYINKYKKPIEEIIKEYGIKTWRTSGPQIFRYDRYVVRFNYKIPEHDKKNPNRNIHNPWGYFMVYKNTYHHCCVYIEKLIKTNNLNTGIEYNIGENKIIRVLAVRQKNKGWDKNTPLPWSNLEWCIFSAENNH